MFVCHRQSVVEKLLVSLKMRHRDASIVSRGSVKSVRISSLAKLKEIKKLSPTHIKYVLTDGTWSEVYAGEEIITLVIRAWGQRFGPWIDSSTIDTGVDRDVIVQVELHDGTKILLAEGNHLAGYCDHCKLFPKEAIKRYRTRRV